MPAPGGTSKLAGRTVARIGFGVMQLAQQAVERDAALAIVRQAVRAGINHIDTARFYGSPRWTGSLSLSDPLPPRGRLWVLRHSPVNGLHFPCLAYCD